MSGIGFADSANRFKLRLELSASTFSWIKREFITAENVYWAELCNGHRYYIFFSVLSLIFAHTNFKLYKSWALKTLSFFQVFV